MDGLQPWAKTELTWRGAQDLATAIAEVESFIDFGTKDSFKPKDKKAYNGKGGGDKPAQGRSDGAQNGKGEAKDVKDSYKSSGCFL